MSDGCFGCAAKAPDFRWVTSKGTQGAPRDLILRWLGVLAPRNARCQHVATQGTVVSSEVGNLYANACQTTTKNTRRWGK